MQKILHDQHRKSSSPTVNNFNTSLPYAGCWTSVRGGETRVWRCGGGVEGGGGRGGGSADSSGRAALRDEGGAGAGAGAGGVGGGYAAEKETFPVDL